MVAEGAFPYPGGLAEADPENAPRVGDGLLRLDRTGHVVYASPNALSAHRRLGIGGDLLGQHLGRTLSALVAEPGALDEPRASAALAGALRYGEPRESEVEAEGAVVPAPGDAPGDRRGAPRGPGAGPRRHRAAPARPAADGQGRDHPRDPPPGEEQPADGRGAAAPAGTADDRPGARAARSRSRCAGCRASRWCTRPCRSPSTTRWPSTRSPTASWPCAPRSRRRSATCRWSGEGSFGELAAEVATPLAMVLTELVQNAVEHGFPGRPASSAGGHGAGPRAAAARRARRRGPRRRRGAACRLRPDDDAAPGPADRAHAGGGGAAGDALRSGRPSRPAPRRSWTCRSRPDGSGQTGAEVLRPAPSGGDAFRPGSWEAVSLRALKA